MSSILLYKVLKVQGGISPKCCHVTHEVSVIPNHFSPPCFSSASPVQHGHILSFSYGLPKSKNAVNKYISKSHAISHNHESEFSLDSVMWNKRLCLICGFKQVIMVQ